MHVKVTGITLTQTKLEEKFTIVLYSLVNSIAFGVRIALV